MQSILKLSVLSLCAFNLSGCTFTQNVAQSAYDYTAEENCSSQYSEPGSIHASVKSNCVDGIYVPKDKPKSKSRETE